MHVNERVLTKAQRITTILANENLTQNQNLNEIL